MSTLSSHCRNCGSPKPVSNYADIYCMECQKVKEEAEAAVTATEGASISDALRAGKIALSHRSQHAFQNRVDPRSFTQNNRHPGA